MYKLVIFTRSSKAVFALSALFLKNGEDCDLILVFGGAYLINMYLYLLKSGFSQEPYSQVSPSEELFFAMML